MPGIWAWIAQLANATAATGNKVIPSAHGECLRMRLSGWHEILMDGIIRAVEN
jgi:hypothetical protein